MNKLLVFGMFGLLLVGCVSVDIMSKNDSLDMECENDIKFKDFLEQYSKDTNQSIIYETGKLYEGKRTILCRGVVNE